MTANLRRAATSVALNIAEGAGRGTSRDFMHFIDVASGSLFETVVTFIVAGRLGYIGETDLDGVRASAQLLGRKLHSFKRSLAA